MTRPTPLVLILAAAVASSLAAIGARDVRAQDAQDAASPAAAQQPPARPAQNANADANADAAETEAQKQEKEKHAIRQSLEQEVRSLPTVTVRSITDVLQFQIEDDDLRLTTTIPPTDARTKVNVDGYSGVLIVKASGQQPGDGKPYVPDTFQLVHHDFDKPGAVVSITTIVVIGGGHLNIARDADLGARSLNLSLIQSGQYLEETNHEKVRLYIAVTDEKTGNNVVDHKLAALNVVDLRRRYPAETTTYLEPIFRDLGASGALFTVDPRAAWQVLAGSYKPSEELSRKLGELVKQLDADDPKARDAAAAELEKLGQPAALVLMRQDRSGWSEEQAARIDAFLAPYKPLPEDEARRSRTDIEFLLLSLAADDDALRQAALEQLQTVTKKQIAFDLKATGQARHDAVSKLREELLGPATRPTTNPAQANQGAAPVER